MVMMLVMMMLMMMMLMMVMMMRGGMLRMGWYSQGHKFGLIDGNRWEQPWAQSGLPAQNTALVLCIWTLYLYLCLYISILLKTPHS